MNFEHYYTVGELMEMVYVERELEKYSHLGALASITEELYFAIHAE